MLIEAKDLVKTYRIANEELLVLDRVSFAVPQGQMISLLGPSGSGKTTLLNILGLIESPTSGSVRVGEHLLSDPKVDRDELRRYFVSQIYQQFHLLPQLSALDNVCLPLVPVRPKFSVKDRAVELLKKVGLEERMHHKPSELSGGEQQRVAIARALLTSPQLLLCDEPTGNLDRANRDLVLDLLQELNREGLTILIATHDQDVADRCHSSLTVRDGKLYSQVMSA